MSEPILTTASLRALEHRHADASPPLMERAGQAAAQIALEMLAGRNGLVLVLAGPGNNGGDAFVVARRLLAAGKRVALLFVADLERLPADARAAREAWLAAGGDLTDTWPNEEPALIVDGLFGIGLTRPLEAPYTEWITKANASRCPILALDVPSGLDVERGRPVGPTIVAQRTATFIALKPGLLTGDGPDHCGEITCCSLALAIERGDGSTIAPDLFATRLSPRRKNSHKGDYGSLAVIGGAAGMTGAALLAGRAALLLGAGRVFLGLIERMAVDPQQPELMLRAPADALSCAEVIAIGPGLGRTLAASEPLLAALEADKALVIDADALHLIAESPLLARRLAVRQAPTLLTPHPGEAASLLGVTSGEIQNDRLAAARELARRFRAHVVLKGCGSIVVTPEDEWFINTTGHAGLATAGAGDVLTGFIGALLAQKWDARSALLAAVHLHGLAAERLAAAGDGPIGLAAGELPAMARRLFNDWILRLGR